jgi:hypothetical protein
VPFVLDDRTGRILVLARQARLDAASDWLLGRRPSGSSTTAYLDPGRSIGWQAARQDKLGQVRSRALRAKATRMRRMRQSVELWL